MLRGRARRLNDALRLVRRELRRAGAEVSRLRNVEKEAEQLRRELGPQRPLLKLPETPPSTARELWIPAVVERHLTALHDHDVGALETLFAPDAVVVEAAFPREMHRGRAAVAAFHAQLFTTWTDFRFMPRYWHNLGGAAFLEGDANFVQCGEWHGITAAARPISSDLLLIYHLAGERIGRVKLYYDAAGIRRQLALAPAQGELF